MTNNVNLDLEDVTIHSITNLYLYGTTATPSAYEDRLRSSSQYGDLPVLHIDMEEFMTSGAGRYAHASMASFVQEFFDGITPISLADGEYTKADLIANHGYTNADFIISLKQYDIDSESADYASRVYIFNNTSFEISDSAVFVVDNGGTTKYVRDMAVHAFDDDFNFESDFWEQIGNDLILKGAIDPNNIGRTFQIEYENKSNVPVVEEYTASDFLTDQIATANEEGGTLLLDALPAMLDVVEDLETAGTIDYTTSSGDIIYGSNSNNTLYGSVNADVLVSGEGEDVLYGYAGNDTLDGGDDTDTADYTYATQAVTVNLATGGATVSGGGDTDTLAAIENIIGSDHNDAITGSSVGNALNGLGGDDELNGGDGNDTLDGGDGNDILTGGDDDNTLTGGAGNDVFVIEAHAGTSNFIMDISGDWLVDLAYGSVNRDEEDNIVMPEEDLIDLSAFSSFDTFNDLMEHFTPIYDEEEVEVIAFELDLGSQVIAFNPASLYITPFSFLFHDEGIHVQGNGDMTETYGTRGNDRMTGTAGADYLRAGPGNDFLFGGAGAGVNSAADGLSGGRGNDMIDGGDGDDDLYGGWGDDTLFGGTGHDLIHAGLGNDHIYGGYGGDGINLITFSGETYHTDGESVVYFRSRSESLAVVEWVDGVATINPAPTEPLPEGSGMDRITCGVDDYIDVRALGFTGIQEGQGGGTVLGYYWTGMGYLFDDANSDFAFIATTQYGELVLPNFDFAGGQEDLAIFNNPLVGGDGGDTLVGGAEHDDLFSGGGGANYFKFSAKSGASDRIIDFVHGTDIIDLSDTSFSAINAFVDLSITNDSGDAVIAVGGGHTIRLVSVNYTELSASDFIFAGEEIENEAPEAVADSYGLNQGATLVIDAVSGVLANDSDADEDALSAILVSDVTHGTLTLNANGSFTYEHDNSSTTTDSFTYKVNDGTEDGNTVTVSLTISVPNVVNGTSGEDVLVGTSGVDSISGSSGDDAIYGGAGDDILNGGAGGDAFVFTAESGATDIIEDFVHGTDLIKLTDASFSAITGIGDLTITNDSGDAVIALGSGQTIRLEGVSHSTLTAGDFAFYGGSPITTGGTSGGDTLTGSADRDSISGGNGDDSILGGNSNDTLDGGTGNDTLYGGNGDDSLGGSSNNDVIYGDAGNDTISDMNGVNTISGGAGDDIISVGNSGSVVDGGDGHDSISGSGALNITAGLGDDTIIASALTGFSTVDLGDGDNLFDWSGAASTGATISIIGGSGNDTMDVRTGSATVYGGAGNDYITTYNSADYLDGGDGNDTITAGSGTDTLYGGAGDDSLTGGGDIDLVSGGDGNDIIVTTNGNGVDSIYGGAGNDTITVGSSSSTVDGGDGHDAINGSGVLRITAGLGDDTVTATATLTSFSTIDLGDGTNRFEWGFGSTSTSATISITGGANDDYILVKTGAATLIGGAGNDDITSYSGADSIDGGGGADTIDGSSGNNTITGGDGNDSITAAGGNDSITGGLGADTISAGTGTNTVYGGDGTDSITGSSSADLFYGDAGADTISAGDGANTVYGGDANDSITSGTGADQLYGDAGDDVLSAGTGNDTLYGGAGVDTMTGSTGTDHFVFTSLTESTDSAQDNITDFVHGTDKINLAGLGFTGIASGSGSGATLGYSQSSGHTYIVDADSDFSIDLTGTITLTSSDFIFS